MSTELPTSYLPSLVALAFLISAVGAFVALTVAGNIAGSGRRVSRFNAIASGAALGGIGVWSMHFIGMLSLKVNMAVSYSVPETVISLVAAVAVSAGLLGWLAPDPSPRRIVVGGVVLGLGVSAMHYIGMFAMRFGGYMEWSLGAVALSIGIAIAAATAALWLAFSVRSFRARVVASVIMAAAVSAMHFTGMEAASLICTTPRPQNFPEGDWLIPSMNLPVLVSLSAFGMAFVILVDQMFQRLARREEAQRMARVMPSARKAA